MNFFRVDQLALGHVHVDNKALDWPPSNWNNYFKFEKMEIFLSGRMRRLLRSSAFIETVHQQTCITVWHQEMMNYSLHSRSFFHSSIRLFILVGSQKRKLVDANESYAPDTWIKKEEEKLSSNTQQAGKMLWQSQCNRLTFATKALAPWSMGARLLCFSKVESRFKAEWNWIAFQWGKRSSCT